MDWGMAILFLHADGCYSWQTKRANPKKLSHRVLHAVNRSLGWKGLFLGNLNGKWWITNSLDFLFCQSWCRVDPVAALGSQDMRIQHFYHQTGGPEPQIWRVATNAVIHSMDEGAFGNLCVFFFSFFFVSVGKTVFLFHPKREQRSSFWLSSFQSSLWPLFLLELEESPLTVKSDMATIVKVMQLPDSGLEIRDRMWLKITISNAVIGKQIPGILRGEKSVL